MNTEVPDLELAVRIAINTGETLVTVDAHPERGEAMVAGDVVNTASRLQGAAPVGALVVGETTHRTTEPIFEWEGLDPVELKGKAEPTRLWRVVQARGRFGVDIMRAPTTPFVGREVDLALLQQIYDRTLRERSVQLVTLVGEPGVGKSRIISELFGYVDAAQRARHLAPGTLPALRRRHLVLGAGRDREGPGRHPGIGHPGAG